VLDLGGGTSTREPEHPPAGSRATARYRSRIARDLGWIVPRRNRERAGQRIEHLGQKGSEPLLLMAAIR